MGRIGLWWKSPSVDGSESWSVCVERTDRGEDIFPSDPSDRSVDPRNDSRWIAFAPPQRSEPQRSPRPPPPASSHRVELHRLVLLPLLLRIHPSIHRDSLHRWGWMDVRILPFSLHSEVWKMPPVRKRRNSSFPQLALGMLLKNTFIRPSEETQLEDTVRSMDEWMDE